MGIYALLDGCNVDLGGLGMLSFKYKWINPHVTIYFNECFYDNKEINDKQLFG
jgi:hypothetical protein